MAELGNGGFSNQRSLGFNCGISIPIFQEPNGKGSQKSHSPQVGEARPRLSSLQTPQGNPPGGSSSAAPQFQAGFPLLAGHRQPPGSPRAGLLFFPEQYFPAARAGAQLSSSSSSLPSGGMQGRSCPRGCQAGAAAAPGCLGARNPRATVDGSSCYLLAPGQSRGRKTRGEIVPQSCARSACDALCLRPCQHKPLWAGAPSVLPQGPPPTMGRLLFQGSEMLDFSISAAVIAGGMGMLGGWRGGGCS